MNNRKNPNQSKESIAPDGDGDGPGYFAAYSEHSNLLRSWLVLYGIGGPVLILSQDKLWGILVASKHIQCVAILFLLGVFIQVFLAALNKLVMWACYYGEMVPSYKSSRRYKWASNLSELYLIDFICDVFAMSAFSWATYLCFVSISTAIVT